MPLKESQAQMNLLKPENKSTDDETVGDSSSDSSESVFEIIELHRSVSAASIESADGTLNLKNSSTTNLLLDPSTSVAILYEEIRPTMEHSKVKSHPAIEDQKAKVYPESEDPKSQAAEDELEIELGFTRDQLHKRLNNLMKLSVKNYNGDPEVV